MSYHIFFVLLFVFMLGCSDRLPITPQEETKAKDIGKESSTTILYHLTTKLIKKMGEKGTVGAAEFCSLQAIPITEELEKKLNVKIKRISQKNRNPKNAPTSRENEVFKHFAKQIDEKSQEYYMEKIQEQDQVFVHYYRPLYIAPVCLQCHGSKLSKPLKKILAKKYPHDKAVDFKVGNIRGLLKVSIPVKVLHEK